MSFQLDALIDIANYLESVGFGTFDLNGTGYATAENPIHFDQYGAEDQATVLTLYPVDTTAGTDATWGLQVRVRGRPGNRADTKNLTDESDNALDGLQGVVWGGAQVVQVRYQGGGNLGPDSNRRMEATRNYYIQLTRATAHRTD